MSDHRRPLALTPALGLIALATALAGCGHSDATRFFTLDPVAPSAPVRYAGPPVRVRAVRIPPALDRIELARETAADEIKVDDFSHWAAPLGQTARQVLTQDLAARLPAGEVAAPDGPAPAGGADLDVEVLSLNVAGGVATLQASWSVLAPGAATASRPPMLVQLQVPTTAPGGAGVADGFSRLLAQLSDRIAADLAQHPTG